MTQQNNDELNTLNPKCIIIFYCEIIEMEERIICVHGNIGAGKTTLIETNKYNDFNRMEEPVDDWADYLPKYYNALRNKKPDESLSLDQQSDIVEF